MFNHIDGQKSLIFNLNHVDCFPHVLTNNQGSYFIFVRTYMHADIKKTCAIRQTSPVKFLKLHHNFF